MKNILTITLLSAALLTTAAHADGILVPVGYDFDADDARVTQIAVAKENKAANQDKESWWSSIKKNCYKLASGTSDIIYGVANVAYSSGMTLKGAAELTFGTGEYIYGAAHNAYGTLRGYDADFMENGKSWSNAGWNNMAYGANDIKDGIVNIPNTAMHFIHGVPKIIDGTTGLIKGAEKGQAAAKDFVPVMV